MQASLENVPQEKKAFSPRDKLNPLNGKIVGKVNSPRKSLSPQAYVFKRWTYFSKVHNEVH